MRILSVAIVVAAFVMGAVYAQEHDHGTAAAKPAAATKAAARPAAAKDGPEEIFCGSMKTGQLCSTGTTSLFGLTDEKRDAWVKSVRTYNNAVNAAIMALQADARTNLSPAQVAEVNRWFAIGINPQINEILAATAKAGSK
jgi:hypothetical protein